MTSSTIHIVILLTYCNVVSAAGDLLHACCSVSVALTRRLPSASRRYRDWWLLTTQSTTLTKVKDFTRLTCRRRWASTRTCRRTFMLWRRARPRPPLYNPPKCCPTTRSDPVRNKLISSAKQTEWMRWDGVDESGSPTHEVPSQVWKRWPCNDWKTHATVNRPLCYRLMELGSKAQPEFSLRTHKHISFHLLDWREWAWENFSSFLVSKWHNLVHFNANYV